MGTVAPVLPMAFPDAFKERFATEEKENKAFSKLSMWWENKTETYLSMENVFIAFKLVIKF